MGAYEIRAHGTFYWFPGWVGHGIIRRGLVDSDGYLNDRGRAALENR